MLCSVHGTSED